MPDTMTELCETIERMTSKSSLFQKADPELRKKLVTALIKREPYTLREVYNAYALAELDISFTAFYYWARKVRRTAALLELARSCGPDEDPRELVQKVLSHRLLDVCLDEDANILVLAKLMQTYRMACYIEFARKRVDNQSEKLKEQSKSKSLEELRRIADRITPAAPRTATPARRAEQAPQSAESREEMHRRIKEIYGMHDE